MSFLSYFFINLTWRSILLSALLSRTIKIAWITAGIHIKKHKKKLINACIGFPQNNTAKGGKNIANKYIIMITCSLNFPFRISLHINLPTIKKFSLTEIIYFMLSDPL